MVVGATVEVRLAGVGLTVVVVVVDDVEVDLKVVEVDDEVPTLDSLSSVDETSSTRLFPTRADPV